MTYRSHNLNGSGSNFMAFEKNTGGIASPTESIDARVQSFSAISFLSPI
jgi:hypothetical protein